MMNWECTESAINILKTVGVTLDSPMTLDTQVTDSDSQGLQLSSPGLATTPELFASWCCSCTVSLVQSLTRGWITATLCMSDTNLNFQRLQRMQNAAARSVCQSPQSPYTQSIVLLRPSASHSIFMLRSHCLEQSSLICTHWWQLH